jgi:peptidoglycan hydrolase-like protein with peptidoglycan-binding domain
MALRRGEKSAAVKELQRSLNRLGALLLVDGDFGGGTEQAVTDARAVLGLPGPGEADDSLLGALARVPDPSPELTAPGVTFIAREEVTSPAEYRRRYKNPVWPTADSGITIGIGYDLRFADRAKLEEDWGATLGTAIISRLAPVSGTRGSAELLASVRDVEVPLPHAVTVFLKRMLPEHVRKTRNAYPQLDSLPAARRTALISLVFNRGASFDGGRRREMKRIRELLDAGDTEAVPEQIESMIRLWNPQKEGGVIARRRREATLWRSGFGGLQLE